MSVEPSDRPWRNAFLPYDRILAQVDAWVAAHPERVRRIDLGTTPEGRPIVALDIGPEPARIRPAMMVSANMHATELAGSSVALAFAEAVIGAHGDGVPKGVADDLPPTVAAALRDVRFFVVPRITPDGGEHVLDTGRQIRSVPRVATHAEPTPRWIRGDLTGDGRSRLMRVKDPNGQLVAHDAHPGLLLPRRIDDPPPYYKVFPEGTIAHFDGTVPDPSYAPQLDLNRNFPWSWKPEPTQAGAGDFPGSAPESRALLEFAVGHPEIFAWVDFHTFGGVCIRPDGEKPDNKMDRFDLAVFRQLGEWAEAATGYPMVSGAEEFCYRPDVPIYGDLIEFAYHQRGAFAYVVELHDLFAQMGIERQKPFIDSYRLTREQMADMAQWDAEHNGGRGIGDWVPFEHPQLGPVEIGTGDPIFGFKNPPPSQMPDVCDRQVQPLLRLAAIGPRLALDDATITDLSDGLRAVSLTVRNAGYLPTHVCGAARERSHNEPLWAEISPAPVNGPARVKVGHLKGWGSGLDGSGSPMWPDSPGHADRRLLRWVVAGEDAVTVRVGSRRVGWVEWSSAG